MGTSGHTFKGIETVLLGRFPELRGRLQESFGSYYDLKSETPAAYPVFEDVLQHTILELLRTDEDNNLLRRIFSFLEEMASSADRDVTDLLGIAILEPLVFDRGSVRSAWKYMGEKTKELARETAGYEDRLDNLPTEAPGGNK